MDVLPFVPLTRLPDASTAPRGRPLPELWQGWEAARGRGLKPSSQKNYARVRRLSASLGDYPTPGDVVLWLASLQSMGLAPGTVAQARDILHGVYTLAQHAGWATTHPVALAPWRRPPPAQLDPVTELPELWPRIRDVAGATPRERAFLGVLYHLGLRLEEALGLERRHVAQRAAGWRLLVRQQRSHPNRWTVTGTKGQRGRGARDLPVPAELRELLAPVVGAAPVQLRLGTRGMPREVRPVPFLFPFRQHELAAVRERLEHIAPETFGPHKAWHQFRRGLATRLRLAGKPTRTIADVLGHESEKTTEGYFGRLTGARVAADALDLDEEGAP